MVVLNDKNCHFTPLFKIVQRIQHLLFKTIKNIEKLKFCTLIHWKMENLYISWISSLTLYLLMTQVSVYARWPQVAVEMDNILLHFRSKIDIENYIILHDIHFYLVDTVGKHCYMFVIVMLLQLYAHRNYIFFFSCRMTWP